MREEIIYPFPSFKSYAVEVRVWLVNFNPQVYQAFN